MPSKEFTERQRRRQKLDASGQVARAWLLTPEEAAREKPRR